MSENTYKLDDSVISHIAKILQVSMLTGTDIVDHIRMVRLDASDTGTLVLSDDYSNVFDVSIDKMMEASNDKGKE